MVARILWPGYRWRFAASNWRGKEKGICSLTFGQDHVVHKDTVVHLAFRLISRGAFDS